MSRPSWEVLIGDMATLDYLASLTPEEQQSPHPLQEIVEDIIDTELTEFEREVFYLRFGENLSFRDIATRCGYDSHQTFQYHVEKIIEKVRKGLESRGSGDAQSVD